MKTKLIYTLATFVVLMASGSIYALSPDGGPDPPACNPLVKVCQ